jgi:predicted nucleic acid-binding Zn ribbon protein
MTCPYCGSSGNYVVHLEDEEMYYCYECGARFKY